MSRKLISVDFEVFGTVQGTFVTFLELYIRNNYLNCFSGVFFRKVGKRFSYECLQKTLSKDLHLFQYTQKEAQDLNLKGFCRNTSQGTVQGTMEGEVDKVNKM